MNYRQTSQDTLIEKSYENNEISFEDKSVLKKLNDGGEVMIVKYATQTSGSDFKHYISAINIETFKSVFKKEI